MIPRLVKYVENTRQIRALSTPSLDSLESPGEYEGLLKESFRHIGRLAEENRGLLEGLNNLDANLVDNYTPEEVKEIIDLFIYLAKESKIEQLDLPLSNMISSYLWDNVLDKVDTDEAIFIANMHAVTCYLMMNYTYRTHPFSKVSGDYYLKGREACDYIVSFLESEKWDSIKRKETRKLILKRVPFEQLFYMDEGMYFSRNEEQLEVLRHARSLESEELYQDTYTPEEWIAYKVKIREMIGGLLESDNIRGFTYSQCCEIRGYMEELLTLWKEYPEICMVSSTYNLSLFYYYRACYYTGEITGTVYKSKLLEIYRGRSTKKFTRGDVVLNLLLPVEYVKLMKKRRSVESELATLEQFYRNAINYVFQCPNLESINFILDYLLQLISHFDEIPGGTSFEEIGLECLAALHPTTYVHSKMVANITRCLCKHLLRLNPELFSDMVDSDDIDEIRSYRGEILDFAYHSAICHDFGKIAIMDTVFMYGRNIMDLEFDQIKAHPQIGEKLLAGSPSTYRYKNVAMGHHKWYNEKGGYPWDTSIADLKEAVVIYIVTCADCMDAATDQAGRSYSKGITLDQYIKEVGEQAGTRYAPFLPALLEDEEVRKDLDYLLSEVRQVLYRDTFVMLKRLQRLGGYTEIFGGLTEV